MPSTKRSSTKSGAAKSGPSKACAPTKSKSTSLATSDQPADAPPKSADDVFKQVVSWVLAGHSEFDLAEAIAEFFPGTKRLDLMAKVAAHFQKAGEADGTAVRGFCIEAYREIYRKALDISDLSTALKALARLEQTAK